MRLFITSAIALSVALSAHAEDTSRDEELITTVNQADIRFVAESLDHTIRQDIDDGIGVVADYASDEDSPGLVYGMQGKACQESSDCLGLEIFVIFEGDFTAEEANSINQRWSAIKATATETSLYLTRYLILDQGQTIGNLRTNVRNTLGIAEQVQAEQTAPAEAPTEPTEPEEPVRLAVADIDFGEDAGNYANDDACDDARFHEDGDEWSYQRNHVLQDATDCRTLYAAGEITLYLDFGDNSGEYANDDTCDDNRFTGEGRSILQTDSHVKRDAVDCIVAYRAGRLDRP